MKSKSLLMKSLRKDGWTYQEIGMVFSCTKQNVYLMINPEKRIPASKESRKWINKRYKEKSKQKKTVDNS